MVRLCPLLNDDRTGSNSKNSEALRELLLQTDGLAEHVMYVGVPLVGLAALYGGEVTLG